MGTKTQFRVLVAVTYAGAALTERLSNFLLVVTDTGDDPQPGDHYASHVASLQS
jgi:hypothetical protein